MKKVLALVLAATMALGMATTTFAAALTKDMKSFAAGYTLTNGYANGKAGSLGVSGLGYAKDTVSGELNGATGVVDMKSVVPTGKVRKDAIFLTSAMFGLDGPNRKLTASEINALNIKVHTSFSTGSAAKVLSDKLTVNASASRIDIPYVKEHVSTKSVDFEFTVYLTLNGTNCRDDSISFSGSLKNEEIPAYEGDDIISTDYGYKIVAYDFIQKIEVELGNGVSIITKMFQDKEYYGTASRDPDEADDRVFAKYPDVDNVVTLKTVGLNSTGDRVILDTDYSDYYVYDKDMNYLGQSNVMLPYSTKYYLANKKLDIVDDEETTTEEAPEATDDGEGENPESGGDEGIENSNANPSTGC